MPSKLATKDDLQEMYSRMLPYMGGMPEVLANKFDKANLYSTTEKIIGCWIDGRPLYQRVITGTITSNGNVQTISIDASISYGFVKEFAFGDTFKQTGSLMIPNVTEVSSSSFPFFKCYLNLNTDAVPNTLAIINRRDGWIGLDFHATVVYTKTTDSANSFNYSSDTDYSTSEKIIGTWIDSKPIYQKTIQDTMPNCTTTGTAVIKNVALGVSVDKYISISAMLDNGAGMFVTLPFSNGAWVWGTSNSAVSSKNTAEIRNANTAWNGKTVYITLQYTKTN